MSKEQGRKHEKFLKSASYQHPKEGLTRRPLREGEPYKIGNEEKNKSTKKMNKLYPDLPEDEDMHFQKLYPDLPTGESDVENENANDEEEGYDDLPKESQEYFSFYKYFPFLHFNKSVGIMLILLLAFCSFILRFDFNMAPRKDVTKVLEGMKYHFKNQHHLTYRILKSEFKKVVDVTHEPSAPAVVTLIANRGAEDTASRFSEYLAQEFAPHKNVLINDSVYWHGDPEDIMYKIDVDIKSKVQEDQLSMIIVDKVQNIPFKAAMLFHGYCDHELAPYKRAIFMFIVPSNEIIPENANVKYIDSVAMKRLRYIWPTATDDEIDSLITRITVAVINIR